MAEAEEKVNAEDEGLDLEAIEHIYASELEPVRVAVPGHEESWVELLPMDADAHGRFTSAGLKLMRRGQNEEELSVDVNAKELALLEETVSDFSFRVRVRRKNPDAGEDPYQLSDVKASAMSAKLRKAFIREECRRLTRQMRRWLVQECLKVNGLADVMGGLQGNSSGSSTD